jgi:transposase
MRECITFVGIDSSKTTNQVAMLLPDKRDAIEFQVASERRGTGKLIKRIKRSAVGDVKICYEAGPCGYALQRQLQEAGFDCIVVAPSLVPVKPGDRIKTDRRDAKKLAELLRADVLTEVHPPTEEEEAARSLCRCREDARDDLMRARQRMGKMLLRQNLHYSGKSWTCVHRKWLHRQKFELEADQAVFEDYLVAIEYLEERLRGLNGKLEELSLKEPYREPVGWLRCFRGIDTITAMTIVTELHDFSRFHSPRELMSYLGLVPGESSSGSRRRRGAITKAGNGHVRRALIESSWHYRHRPMVGKTIKQRREGQPGWVIATADRAQARLHRKYWKMVLKGKHRNKSVTAVARELVGFIWAVLHHGAETGSSKAQVKRYVLERRG